MPTGFTPVSALAGGALIGLAGTLHAAEALAFVAALMAGSQLARALR